MVFGKPHKQKKKKEEIENYYKILNTRANATPETIKKKYIESIKQYPPETHPEEFQRIRRAYETLRDPHKRSEYDLQRKYGGKLEALLDEAIELSNQGKWIDSGLLYDKVLAMDSRSISALLGMGHVALHTETDLTVEEYFDKAVEYSDAKEEKLYIRIYQARLLHQHSRSRDALKVLEEIEASYPEAIERYIGLYCDVFVNAGRKEEAWALINAHIPPGDNQKDADIEIFIEWINMMIRLNKWNLFAKIQQRVRKFLKSLTDEEERQAALLKLMDESDSYWDVGSFRESLLFAEFAQYLDPKDGELRDEIQKIREQAAIEKELDRLMRDPEMFPLVTMQAFEWFYAGFLEDEDLEAFRNSIPYHLLKEMEAYNEEYAAGIVRLKKKYPLVYRDSQEEWDELYLEKIASLNREQRRRIR